MCDRVAIIARGELVAAGSPAELSHAGGVEVVTGRGTRTFEQATREDIPRIVRELVEAGEDVYEIQVLRSTLEDTYLEVVGEAMSGVLIVAGFALRESLRRRVFIVVALLTVGFLALYGLGVWQIAKDADEIGGVDSGNGVESRTLAGATLLGLSMFATLFLGAILAVFLTLNAVRGDAERGLLQPMVVRPLPRAYVLLGRFLAAASVCAVYVIVVFVASAVLTDIFVDWWPDRVVVPALELAAAVAVIAALALAGSVVLSTHRERDRGLHALRRGPGGRAAGADRRGAELGHARARVHDRLLVPAVRGALPDRAAGASPPRRSASRASPSTSARSAARRPSGRWLAPFTVAYLAALGAAALWAFRRRDL